jgi:hypothetical protein
VLYNRGCDHAEHGEDEPGRDLLEWRKVEAYASYRRIDELVEDWDHDKECDGIQIVDDVIRDAV